MWICPQSHSATKTIRAPCYYKLYFPSPLLAYSSFASLEWLLLTLPISIAAAGPLTQLIPYLHTFTFVSLLLALMADLCLPLSAGEDTFKLHSVQLELEAVEKQIHELLGKQAQLREWRVMLETSRADAHKSGVSMQQAANTPTTSTLCFSAQALCTRDTIFPDVLHPVPGNHAPWVQQRKKRSRLQTMTSPLRRLRSSRSPRNLFSPLRETGCDAVIIGNSIVRHVRATLTEGKVHTHCFPGAWVLNDFAQIPAILKGDEGRIGCAARGGERHQAVADRDTEEGLQEPDCPRRRSLCQDLFPRIDEDTKGSVDCLL